MQSFHCRGSPSALSSHNQSLSSSHKFLVFTPIHHSKHPKSSTFNLTCQSLGLDNIAAVIHNKVLIAASVSSAIAQLSKPFTNTILYKKNLDFKAVRQSGGFPSSHSSAVVASATVLGLERGFSDSVFGLSVVFAALVMYDAQGVRREVGNHAKVINQILLRNQVNLFSPKAKEDQIDSKSGASSFLKRDSLGTLSPKKTNSSMLKTTASSVPFSSDGNLRQTTQTFHSSGLEVDIKGADIDAKSLFPLKESVGHTEIEVIAGAVLGFTVSLAVFNIM